MTLSEKIGDMLNQINERTDSTARKMEELSAYAERETMSMKADAYKEFGEYQSSEVASLFYDTIRDFYDDYEPSMYRRRESLYNTLDMKMDEYGMVIMEGPGYDNLFNKSFPQGRKGNSLFNLVMVEGWHGGAAGTDKMGQTRTTPHYRMPNPWWRFWDGLAERTTPSPYHMIQRELSKKEPGEFFDTFKHICTQHNNMFVAKMNDHIKEVMSS